MAKFCTACGAALDDDGICSNQKCVRRLLQLLLKTKEQVKEQAKLEQENNQKSAISSARETWETNDIAKIKTLSIE